MVPLCPDGAMCGNSHFWRCKSWLECVSVGPQLCSFILMLPADQSHFQSSVKYNISIWGKGKQMLVAEDRTCGWWLCGLLMGRKRCDFLWDHLLHSSAEHFQKEMRQLQRCSHRLFSARATGCLTFYLQGRQWITLWHLGNSLHLSAHFEASIFLIKQCLLRLLSIRMSFLCMSLMLPDREWSNFSQTAWTKWKSIVGFDSSLSNKQLILQGLVNHEKSLLSTCIGDQMHVRLPVE